MSTLLFSSTPVYNLIGTGDPLSIFISSATGASLISGGATVGDCALKIYSGIAPDANTLIDLTEFDADLLLNFNLPAYSTLTPPLGSGYRLPYTEGVSTSIKLLVGISQTTATAIQSGLATWFWLGRNSQLNDLTDSVFIVGTVGKTTDDADLEIPDNNIVEGEEYKSVGCYLTLPFKFTI